MKMSNAIYGLMMVLVWVACDQSSSKSNQNAEVAQEEPTQEEMAAKTERLISQLIKSEDIGLQGNQNKKWIINPESYKKLMQVKQQIYAISGYMDAYEIARFNEIGNEILNFVETIPELEDSQANTEMQKVLKITKNQCLHLIESDLQNAQVAVVNLSILYDEVPKYFVPKK